MQWYEVGKRKKKARNPKAVNEWRQGSLAPLASWDVVSGWEIMQGEALGKA
jgi:hypothetical protein